MQLDPEAQDLLAQLVAAARAAPRGLFLAMPNWGGNVLQHAGLPDGAIDGYDEGDLGKLMEAGLLRGAPRGPHGNMQFELRREAFVWAASRGV